MKVFLMGDISQQSSPLLIPPLNLSVLLTFVVLGNRQEKNLFPITLELCKREWNNVTCFGYVSVYLRQSSREGRKMLIIRLWSKLLTSIKDDMVWGGILRLKFGNLARTRNY